MILDHVPDWLAAAIITLLVIAGAVALAFWGNSYDHHHGGTCRDRGGHPVIVGKVPVCRDATRSP